MPGKYATRCVLLCLAAGCGRIAFDATSAELEPIELVVSRFSTSSSAFVSIPGAEVAIPPSDGRTWVVLTSAALGSTSPGEVSVEARYLVDGVERGFGGTQTATAGELGPWQHVLVLDGSSEIQRIAYELHDAAGGTAAIEQLHVVAIPLPEGADPLSASADPIQLVSATSYVTVEKFELTPRAPGDYLMMALAVGSESPGAADLYLQWRDPSGAVVVEDEQLARRAFQSTFHMWRQTLDGPATFTLEAHVGSATSSVRDVRLIGLRLDAFRSADISRQTAAIQTTATAGLEASSLAPVAEGARWLHVATTRMEENCDGGPFAARVASFVVDGASRFTIRHVADNCAYEITYGLVELLRSPPAQLGIVVSSGNGELVIARESAISLLGLP